jgi:CHAT domain-containing protein
LKPFTVALLLSSFVALRAGRPDESGYRLLQKAEYFADLYNWRAASPLFQKAEVILRTIGDQRNAMYAHVGVLRLASTAPILERSQNLADLLSTDPLFRQDKNIRLFALTVKGDLDGEIDQSAARRDWTEVMQLAKELGKSEWIYRAEGQLGLADYYDGDVASCQRRVAAALIGAMKYRDVGAEIFFLSATAEGYLLQRLSLNEAIQYANQASAIASAHPDAGSPKTANQVLIEALAATGNAPKAEELVRKLLSDENLDYAERIDYLSSAGDVEIAENKVQPAINYYDQAMFVAEQHGGFRQAADLQATLSKIYLSLGNVSKSEELARSACTTLKRFGGIPLLPAKLDLLAQVLVAQHKYTEADAIYDQADTLQDALIGKAGSLIVQTALITGADQLYAHHFALLADHFNNVDKAYDVVEQGRGRALVDLLLSHASASPKAVETERVISKLQLQMKSLQSRQQIERQKEAILVAEQARAVNPDFTLLGTKQFRPIPIRSMQQILRPSDMLLEYVVAEPSSYVMVLTPTSKQIIKLAGRKTIEDLVGKYTNAIQQRVDARTQARKLYDILLRPVPQIEGKPNYIVIPDGCLNLLPFDALVDQHDQYVVQSHVVSYAPSSTTLYLLRSKQVVGEKMNALLAVGGVPYGKRGAETSLSNDNDKRDEPLKNLMNSEPEVEAATEAIRNPQNEELEGTAATETNLKRALKREFGYIHLAVHAFSSDNPDRASLVLLSDPSNGEDGFLQASEIVQMRIPAKLVVLSACETNVGPIRGEEGISALSTAFLLAGARTVVSTLWPIEDQTSFALMQSFYRHLGKGESGANSMADAKRDLLAKYGASSLPIYWAGFVVQGSGPNNSLRANR